MNLQIDEKWTLFLDRDGVVNEKIVNGYVKNFNDFFFIKGALEAISILSLIFVRIIIVTNQRGVGRGLMKEEDLTLIHEKMISEIKLNSGRIDKIYYCTDVSEFSSCRKPNPGMGIQALSDFPEIDFHKSIIVGDSISDLLFGKNLGMKKVYIGESFEDFEIDGLFPSLLEFSSHLKY
jgi:histidinol-phosphate phosphatase family protein